MRPRDPGRRGGRRGVALLFVLGTVIVLAAVATGLHDSTMGDWRTARRELDRVRAEAVARSGLELVQELLRKDTRPYFWVPDSSGVLPVRADGTQPVLSDVEEAWLELARSRKEGLEIDGARLEVQLIDEAARVALNRVPRDHLERLLTIVSQSYPVEAPVFPEETRAEAQRDLVSAIMDWRDPDAAEQPGGAEASYYQGLSPLPYQPRNGAFQAREELLLVKGMDPVLFHGRSLPMEGVEGGPLPDLLAPGAGLEPGKGLGLKDLVTVHGLLARVNVNTASAAVLSTIPGLHESPARPALLAALIANRPHTDRMAAKTWMDAVDPAASAQAVPWLDVRTDYVRILSRGRIPGSATMEIEAVFRRLPGSRMQMVSYGEH